MLLQASNLSVHLPSARGMACIVDDISFDVPDNSVLGIVGESGSGKSITCAAMLGLLPRGARVTGSVKFRGKEILGLPESALRRVRGGEIGYVFQDPMTSLNPTMTVGAQIVEAMRQHRAMGRREAWDRATDLLDRVGIKEPQRRAHDYPHQYSGGMRQRAMIAIAISCDPKMLIADEPTTALDVTVQAQILDLLLDMRESLGLSLLFISHDLSVVANVCDDVMVMYAGEVVERAAVEDLYARPAHPYTQALLAATRRTPGRPLVTLHGVPPAPGTWDGGCRFGPRCGSHAQVCSAHPSLRSIELGSTRCHFSP